MTSHAKLKHHKDYLNYLIGCDCCDEEPYVIADFNRHMEKWRDDLSLAAHAPTDLQTALKVIKKLIEQQGRLVELLGHPIVENILNKELDAIVSGKTKHN